MLASVCVSPPAFTVRARPALVKQARQSSLLLGAKKSRQQVLSGGDDQLPTWHAAQSNIIICDSSRLVSINFSFLREHSIRTWIGASIEEVFPSVELCWGLHKALNKSAGNQPAKT